VCEPLCRGFEHATFNAALLHTVVLAFPGASVEFRAEREHLGYVRQHLESAWAGSPAGVRWSEVPVPARHLHGWQRLPAEWRFVASTLRAAIRPVRAVIFCSVTPTLLLALKVQLLARPVGPTLAVFHNVLAALETGKPRRPWNWVLALQHALRLPHPAGLIQVVLGRSLYTRLEEIWPVVGHEWGWIDIPYHWDSPAPAPATAPPSVVRFGYFGVGSKGFDTFHSLARRVALTAVGQASEFVLVGFLDRAGDVERYAGGVAGVGSEPLTREEFRRRASKLTYAVWTADPRHYALVASASFLDAISFGKPGIYLRNRYVEHYFDEMGDIGYLCDTVEEMAAVMQSILQEFPTERYRQQIANIYRCRSRFEPPTLAPRLRFLTASGETVPSSGRPQPTAAC